MLCRQEAIELGSTRRGQQRLQQTECLRLSLLAGRAHQPHQTIARRANDSLRPKAIAGEPQKENRFIVFERSVDEPLQQPLVVLGARQGVAQVFPNLPKVVALRLLSSTVRLKRGRADLQLIRHKSNRFQRRKLEVLRNESQVPQGAQLHGDPQPIGGTTTDGNKVAVRTCQRE